MKTIKHLRKKFKEVLQDGKTSHVQGTAELALRN
jgi:hypothetical protein